MMSTKKANLPGFIDQSDFSRPELHGFEVNMSGQIIVPDFHPRAPEQLAAFIEFESKLRMAIDAAA